MKTPIRFGLLASLLSLLTSPLLHAADKGGNGGVAFDCGPRGIQLVDAWEAEDLGHPFDFGDRNAPLGVLVRDYLVRLAFFDESRTSRFYETAQIILSDLKLLEADSRSPKTQLVRFTDGPLTFSLDSDEINAPAGCEKVQVVTQKAPQISGERLFTIYRPLWSRMDNAMKALTILHELWVRDSVARGYTSTTRPARLMNQFIASPRLAGEATVCDYYAQMRTAGMGKDGFTYGGFSIWSTEGAECDPSTRRPTLIPGSNRDFTFTNLVSESGARKDRMVLRVQSPRFRPDRAEWISAYFIGEVDVAYSYTDSHWVKPSPVLSEEHLIQGRPRSETRYDLSGGKALAETDGSFSIRNMVRSRCSRNLFDILEVRRIVKETGGVNQPNCNSSPVGFADLHISRDGKISLTTRKQ